MSAPPQNYKKEVTGCVAAFLSHPDESCEWSVVSPNKQQFFTTQTKKTETKQVLDYEHIARKGIKRSSVEVLQAQSSRDGKKGQGDSGAFVRWAIKIGITMIDPR